VTGKILSLVVYLFFVPIFFLAMMLGIVLSYFAHPRKTYYPLIPLFSRLLIAVSLQKFSVKGEVPPKKDGPFIFMFNHESMYDVFMLGAAIPYYINSVGWEGVFRWPVFGYFAKRYGAYPIPHNNTDKAIGVLKVAEKILVEDGDSMILSPEGQRTLTGKINPFKKGVFHFTKSTNVASIVPVGLIGAFKANRRDSWVINPGKLEIRFGKVITPEEYKHLSVEELRDLVQEKVVNLLD
jgi:1-acyl-sn-glycerol-3-phosphate acyltransferase